MSISIAIILDKRRIKIRTGKYPVRLRVTSNRVTQNYQTIFDLSQEDYEKLTASRISYELQEVREKLKEIQRTSENVAKEIYPFNFYEFESEYIKNNRLFRERKLKESPNIILKDDFDYSPYHKKFSIFREDDFRPGSISVMFFSCIKRLIKEERLGNAFNYQDTYNSIKKFKGNVLFTDITVSFLNQYEQWMLNKGRAIATVGIKLRPLRTVFNEAIEEGLIKREKCYPFGRRKYQIPTGRNMKKALQQDHIASIYYYQPDCKDERKAKAYWMFCYFANGMNPKDMAHLQWKNIQNDFFVFIRAKTARATRQDPRPISVYISDDIQQIIDEYGNTKKNPNDFVFPILDHKQSPLEKHFTIKSFKDFINDRMTKIGERLGVDKKITTIVSRHSFSTQMKRSGASTEFIQEALGHSDKKTTENYLDSFENSVKKEFASMLTAFKKPDTPKTKTVNISKGII